MNCKNRMGVVLLVMACSGSVGCNSKSITNSPPPQASKTPKKAVQVRQRITARENPTTIGGRGEPSLDDQNRPAAWVYMDGKEGRFREKDGIPLLQWWTDGAVSDSPTFRVEVFEPLLGNPRDFSCALQTYGSKDGSNIVYGIKAKEGMFRVGHEYSLLNPGSEFIIQDKISGLVITEIPKLAPGMYGLAAGIKNEETGAQGLAVTYFTVED